MDFENRIGADFDNVSQRLIYNYIATQPDFRPIPSDAASETAQRQFYDFIAGIYTALYHDPALIGMTTDPDETEDHPNPDRLYKDEAKKYLEARKLRRKNEDIIEGLFDSLQRLGELGTVHDGALVVEKDALGLNPRAYTTLVKHLTALGLSCADVGETLSLSSRVYPEMGDAWKLLATLGAAESDAYDARWRQEVGDEADLPKWQITTHARYLGQIKNRIFKRALFDPAYDYALDVLRALSDDPESYRQFADMLLAQGFQQRSDWGSGTDVTNFIDLTFTKTYAGPEGESFRLQFRTQFESRYHRQILYTFVEDKAAFKALLRQLDALPEPLQDLVYHFTGECRACGFCNQTNRKLPYNNIPTIYRGKPVKMCYYFKTIHTRELTRDMLDAVTALYAWVDDHYEVAA
ncbi:MAG TPA: hypothetical protein PKH77_20695 [Anaerolineae bacterium]|nr:hypothetical protein [Anaerolineae bacterium]